MPDPIITIENLSKRYTLGHQGDQSDGLRHALERALRPWNWVRSARARRATGSEEFWALRDVNLHIQQGEVVGIIGRNGAGKSTLLKILSRITEPTTGRIRLRGRTASLLEVGTGFHGDLTGRENIYLNGAILGMTRSEIKRKFDEIVEFAEVQTFLDTPVKRYSSGMYVRLAFAVAAHLESEILIVDEVLAVGDTAFQKKCLQRMDELAHGDGRTIMLVSHNMAAIQNLCSRCILLKRGCIETTGTTDDVIKYYVEHSIPDQLTGQKLGDETDRAGNGRIRLTDFRIEDRCGNTLACATSGMDVVFAFDYRVNGDGTPRRVDVGFSIASRFDQLLCVFYSSYAGRYLDPSTRHGSFRCAIKRLPLAPGRYVVGARVAVDHEEADWPRSGVGYLDVEAGDFYGTGSTGFRGAPVLIDGVWTVDSGGKAVETAAIGAVHERD